jgi:hypothetical protein
MFIETDVYTDKFIRRQYTLNNMITGNTGTLWFRTWKAYVEFTVA